MSTRSGGPSAGRARGLGGLALALVALAGCATGTPTGPGQGDGRTADPSPAPDPSPTAEPSPGGPLGPTDLTITVDEAGDGADVRSFTLTCDPVGGTHPQADAACASLATDAVRAALEPPPLDQRCTEQYGGPQVATVTGTVDGEPVDAQLDRTNGCGISRWETVSTLLDSKGGTV